MKNWPLPNLLLLAVFAATRLPALSVQYHDSDVNLYARYAAESQAAERRGESFYDLHRRRVEEEIASGTPAQAAALAEYKSVEYPPLAVSVMTLPARLIDNPFDEEFPTGLQPRYTRTYIWLMASFDFAVLLIVMFLVRRLFPAETHWEHVIRCLVYVVCSWPLYGVLYTRLDLGVALLVTASLALLISRVHWCVSFFVLALAVHFKLMPVLLAPLWIVASMPVAAMRWTWRNWVRPLSVRAGVLIAFGLAILAPYYLLYGSAVLEFLSYHKDRGIEIESTWATLLLPARFLGGEWQVYHSHGSVNVQSALAPLLAALATPVLIGLVALVTLLFVTRVRRMSAHQSNSEGGTIAQRWPHIFVGFSMLVLMVSIVANKVFSPQYLVWVLPLIPLLDLRLTQRRLFYAVTFAMCFLTMRIFPDCFVGEIVWVTGEANGMAIFDGPKALGALLLAARNGLCVGLSAALATALLRKSSSHAAVSRSPALRFGSRLNESLRVNDAVAAEQIVHLRLR